MANLIKEQNCLHIVSMFQAPLIILKFTLLQKLNAPLPLEISCTDMLISLSIKLITSTFWGGETVAIILYAPCNCINHAMYYTCRACVLLLAIHFYIRKFNLESSS